MIAIDVRSSDHHVTSVIAGTQNLNELIAAVRALPPDGILAVTNAMRRRSVLRGEVVLRRALERHPRAAARILMARARTDASYRGFRLRFYIEVIEALIAAGAWGLAMRFAVAFWRPFWRRGPRWLIMAGRGHIVTRAAREAVLF